MILWSTIGPSKPCAHRERPYLYLKQLKVVDGRAFARRNVIKPGNDADKR
jgi:hypothetical protein